MEQTKTPEYRAYFFGNMYISQIAHGIQAAHVVTKLFIKYPWLGNEQLTSLPPADTVLKDWGTDHVTKILLNGGYQSNLETIYKTLEIICPILNLPFEKFHEEVDALNGALTSVGVVVDMTRFESENDYLRLEYYSGDVGTSPTELLASASKDGLTIWGATAILFKLLKCGKLA